MRPIYIYNTPKCGLIVLGLLFGQLASARAETELNALTSQEQQTGWRLLFDGKTTKGWTTIDGKPLPQSYVQNASLNPHPSEYMIVSDAPYAHYVLSLDFKITPRCNSGIFVRLYPLQSNRADRNLGYNGIEVAIDDTPTATVHDTGAIYDLVAPTKNAMKPVGQWNHVVITSDRNLLKVNLNGADVSKINFDEWTERGKRPDGSAHKFDEAYKDHPRKGYIGLQDHGSDCWFRNIKLKPLP
jgi:alpha-3'-ketoglucosidase